MSEEMDFAAITQAVDVGHKGQTKPLNDAIEVSHWSERHRVYVWVSLVSPSVGRYTPPDPWNETVEWFAPSI